MLNKYILIICFVIIGFSLRVYKLDQPAIWYDEQVSILVANGQNYSTDPPTKEFSYYDLKSKNDFSNVIEATVNDNGNSLAYNLLLHYWLLCFGNSDFAARSLSMFFSLLIIPIGYIFSKKISQNHLLPILVVLLLSIHPIFVGYSQESRSYMMGTFFSFISSYYFFLIISSNPKTLNYLLYSLFFILTLLTHYLTIYIFISHFIVLIIYEKNKNKWLLYFITVVGVALLFYIWLSYDGFKGLKILEKQNVTFINISSSYQRGDNTFFIPATFENIVTGWLQVVLRLFGNTLQNVGFRIRELFIWLIFPLILILLLIWNIKERRTIKLINILLIMSFTHIVFVTLLAIKSNHCIPFQPPYGNFAAPYVTLLICYSTVNLVQIKSMKKLSLILFSIIVITMIVATIKAYSNKYTSKMRKNIYFDYAEQILQEYKVGDTLVIKTYHEAQLINLYFSSKKEIIQKINPLLKRTYEIR